MRSPRPLTLVAAGLTASMALLVACGSDTPDPVATPGPSASAGVPGGATPTPTPTPSRATIPVSKNTDAITATGAYGKAPKVEVNAPFAIDKTQTRVLEANDDGATVQEGQSITVNYYGVNGRTGKKFDDSFTGGKPVTFPLDQVVPGFKKGLVGQKQGSRVLVAMPGSDGYDASGGSAQAGIEVGDTLLFVVDLVAVPLAGPAGTAVEPKAGLPTVADNGGVPKVTISGEAPKELQVQPLIKGAGAKVTASDQVTINYVWVGWDGRVLEDTYTSKQPATTELSGLLAGIQKGLTGQTVGSRVLLVIPNTYPNGNETPKVDKGEATVLVVDVLFTQQAQ